MKTMAMKYPGRCYTCNSKLLPSQRVGFEVDGDGPGEKKRWRFFCGKECFDKGSLNEKSKALLSEVLKESSTVVPTATLSALSEGSDHDADVGGHFSSNEPASNYPDQSPVPNEPKKTEATPKFTLGWFQQYATWRI